MDFFFYAAHFVFGGVIGWVIESAYRTILEKKLINSGFLHGPFIPIYAFGYLIILVCYIAFPSLHLAWKLLIVNVCLNALEYGTSFLAEKTLKMRLWDYSDMPLNLNGRICLLHSVFWIIPVFVAWYAIFPGVNFVIARIPALALRIGTIAALSFVVFDFILSLTQAKEFIRVMGTLPATIEAARKNVETAFKAFAEKLRAPKFEREYRRAPLWFRARVRSIARKIALLRPQLLKGISSRLSNNIMRLRGKQRLKRIGRLRDFFALFEAIIFHAKFKELKNVIHRTVYTRYAHSIRVAYVACALAYRLRLDIDSVGAGALMHDFFYFDAALRRITPHACVHPKLALRRAQRTMETSPRIENIIMAHMFPISKTAPRSLEAFVVIVSNYAVSAYEYLSVTKKKREIIRARFSEFPRYRKRG